MLNRRIISALFFITVLSAGCTRTTIVTPRANPTQPLRGAILNQLTIEDMRVTADMMARDLVIQEFLYTKPNIPIVAVKPIENKTDLTIDPDIIQKTIRVKLMEKGAGRILFRDEESYRYTLAERMKQSGGKVQITSTTTMNRTQNPTGLGAPVAPNVQTQSQTNTTVTDEASVEKKVAGADYFLTGLIYSTTEVARVNAPRGMRYFQFQFRVTDAQTNIIMWEKEYLVKRQGSFN